MKIEIWKIKRDNKRMRDKVYMVAYFIHSFTRKAAKDYTIG